MAAYLTLFSVATIEFPIQGSDDDRPQTNADKWKDFPLFHKLLQETLLSSTLAIENDRIGHQITRFRWENRL